MKSFEFEVWDSGRLTVNRAWGARLRSAELASFDALMHYQGGTVAKNVLRERTTVRFELPADSRAPEAFFIKRHIPSSWREYVKPLLRFNRPTLGAQHEWNAILAFHEAGIATMTPVALGEHNGSSFLITCEIDNCRRLSDWMADVLPRRNAVPRDDINRVIAAVARVARTMHQNGMHHQDFYVHHLLVPQGPAPRDVYVIDLGRVRRHARLSRRWIVKDLAQLSYSARLCTCSDRLRFLRAYLGRPLKRSDRRLIGRIVRKARTIARHTRKNRL